MTMSTKPSDIEDLMCFLTEEAEDANRVILAEILRDETLTIEECWDKYQDTTLRLR